MSKSTPDRTYRARILVVDDEANLRLLLAREISDRGHEVVVAADSAQAMEEIGRADFDVVLTDIRMPGMDGMALTEWIKHTRPDTDVIVMTGYASVDSAATAVRLGAFDYLLKPFGEMDLVTSSIDRVIQKRRLEEDLRWSIEELRASRASFRSVVEKNSDGIVIVDRKGNVRFANPAVETLLNRKVEELVGGSFGLSVVAGETTEHEIIGRGGERRITEMHVVETEWQGEIAYLASLRDTTERKRAEAALRQYTKRLQTLHEIDQAILAVRSPEEIARAAMCHLRQLVPYLRASVVGFDIEADKATVLAVSVRGETKIGTEASLPLKDVAGIKTMRQGKVNAVEEITTLSEQTKTVQALYAEGLRSYVNIPLTFQGELIGCLNLGSDSPRALSAEHIEVAKEVATSLAVAIQNARLFDQVQAGHKQMQLLSRRLVEAQEVERHAIARELHDEIGQVLTGLKLTLEASMRMPADKIQDRLGEARALVNELMMRVRELSLDLRPAMLDDLGLLPTLLWLFERYTAQTNVKVNFKHAGIEGQRFSPEVETAVYRILQEALTNVARYARVSEVTVRIWADENILNLQVKDQGTGFDLKAAQESGRASGLAGMRERAILLDGKLTIESRPGAATGTRLTVALPHRQTTGKRN